ncbi:DUF1217 domain-containing protein [Parvularcula maris]|uniref:DUF1217 domain-containing protein n=1 Tax=Parvularcula maris TaxID=2965077 RepID=A0A9X2L9L8_9PROT|nr:DUF1217 domain-containing protein [Parvularcula maris]MCQ8185501.1 DUF1217 domain-containing protein [Parvularcula maris]
MTSTYLSYLTFERNYGRPLEPIDTAEAEGRRDLEAEEAYFRAKIGSVSTGAELIADERLLNYALTAFGLSDKADDPELIQQILDEGVFDPFSADAKLEQTGTNEIDTLAKAFWFSDDLVFDFEKQNAIDTVASRFATRTQLTGAALTEAITYFRNNVGSLTTGKQLVQDDKLLAVALTAYGLGGEQENRELIGRALDAGFYNPSAGDLAEESLANTARDSRYGIFARAFAFAEVGHGNVRNPKFLDSVVSNYNRETLKAEAKAAQDTGRQLPLAKFNEREIQYFRENIGNVSSAEELLADERLYRFALTAFDLESQVDSRALVKKVLEEGVADPDSLANKLVDKKFRDFARAFAFAESGDRNVRNPNFAEEVIGKYRRVKLEGDAGEDNIGVRLAAYFDRKAPGLTSWFSVLGDKALREVIFTALDLPDEMQRTNPDKLAEIFEDRLDLDELKDPEGRKKFLQRFTLLYDIRNGAPGQVSNTLALYGIDPTLDAGGGAGGIVSIDPATLGATFF